MVSFAKAVKFGKYSTLLGSNSQASSKLKYKALLLFFCTKQARSRLRHSFRSHKVWVVNLLANAELRSIIIIHDKHREFMVRSYMILNVSCGEKLFKYAHNCNLSYQFNIFLYLLTLSLRIQTIVRDFVWGNVISSVLAVLVVAVDIVSAHHQVTSAHVPGHTHYKHLIIYVLRGIISYIIVIIIRYKFIMICNADNLFKLYGLYNEYVPISC